MVHYNDQLRGQTLRTDICVRLTRYPELATFVRADNHADYWKELGKSPTVLVFGLICMNARPLAAASSTRKLSTTLCRRGCDRCAFLMTQSQGLMQSLEDSVVGQLNQKSVQAIFYDFGTSNGFCGYAYKFACHGLH